MRADPIDTEFQRTKFTRQPIVDFWNDIYEQPDFQGEVFRRRLDIILSWLDELALPRSASVLDVGTGAGRFAAEAVRRGYNTLGMDFSFEMLAKASGNLPARRMADALFLQGRAEALPLPAASFDVIICLGVIPHLPSYEPAIRELSRLLRPGGTLLLSFDNKVRLVNRLDIPMLFKRIAEKAAGRGLEIGSGGRARLEYAGPRTYFLPTIRRSMQAAGLRVLECRSVTEDLLTLFGREVLPRKLSTRLTRFVDRFSNLPVIGSLGGMCVLRVRKNPG